MVAESALQSLDKQGNLLEKRTAKFEWAEFSDTDGKAFTLTAYGFAEPKFDDKTTRQRWIVFLLAAMAGIALVLLFRRSRALRGHVAAS